MVSKLYIFSAETVSTPAPNLFVLFFGMVLEIEMRASYILDKCSIAES